MTLTLLNVTMMVETVVGTTSPQSIALNVHASIRRLAWLEGPMPLLVMVSVITKLIALNVIMMVETVVDLMFLVSLLAFLIVKAVFSKPDPSGNMNVVQCC